MSLAKMDLGTIETFEAGEATMDTVEPRIRELLTTSQPAMVGAPVSLYPKRRSWSTVFRAGKAVSPGVSHTLARQRRDMEYRRIASSPQGASIIQDAIIDRLLAGQDAWPVRAHEEAAFQFSPFTSYWILAVHNVLSQNGNLRAQKLQDIRFAIAEFRTRARRELSAIKQPITETRSETGGLTFGDLLAARILNDMAQGLLTRTLVETGENCIPRTLLDYVFVQRWSNRRQRARGLAQSTILLLKRFADIDPLWFLFDSNASWPKPRPQAALVRVLRTKIPRSWAIWLAWRLFKRIEAGQTGAAFNFLSALMDTSTPGGQQFVAHVVLNIIAYLTAPDANASSFAKISGSDEDGFPRICAQLTIGLAERHSQDGGPDEEIDGQLERALAMLLSLALRRGHAGRRFAGLYLLHLFALSRRQVLTDLASKVPGIAVEALARKWFRLVYQIAISADSIDESTADDAPESDRNMTELYEQLKHNPHLGAIARTQEAIVKYMIVKHRR